MKMGFIIFIVLADGDSDSQLGGAGKRDTEKPVAVADSVRVR